MPYDINETRYRTLLIVLTLATLLCFGAAGISWWRRDPHVLSVGIFIVAGLLNLALIPLAVSARRRASREALERIALVAIGIAFAAILQRLAWYMFVYWVERPDANPFRQLFHFLPFFYVAVVVLIQSRRALQACWTAWAFVSVMVVVGLSRAGVSIQTEGMLPLLLWLLLANPLFILLLHALPHYESALAETQKQVAHLTEAEHVLQAAQTELTRLAYRDTLTDLYNRRYFEEHFQREWERARRKRRPLALMLLDLDWFKAYNDRYGHQAGDGALVEVAHLLCRCASRPSDIVARLGGEEFGVLLPDTTAEGAEEVARRMEVMLREAPIPHEGAPGGAMTLSVGISALERADGPGPAELFEQADKALYEVKRRGRNGILRHGAAPPAAPAPAVTPFPG